MIVLGWVDEPRITDTHAHQPAAELLGDVGGEVMRGAANRFDAKMEAWSYEEMIAEYRGHGIGRAVLLGWDTETNTGGPPVPSDYVAEVKGAHPELFVGFGGVGPLKDDCAEEVVRCVGDLGLSGFRFQQIVQGLDPSNDEHRALFGAIENLGMPVIFHDGNPTPGAYSPDGRGPKIKYGNPILIDDMATEYPDLQILVAHPTYPWKKEQLTIYQQKSNVYMDLSGWLSGYTDEQVLHHAKAILQDEVMFGTGYPMIRPGR